VHCTKEKWLAISRFSPGRGRHPLPNCYKINHFAVLSLGNAAPTGPGETR
jgi:hypothetical protein